MKYIVAHPGARDYYSLSVGLFKLGKLDKLYTDFYKNGDIWDLLLKNNNKNRYTSSLPLDYVRSYNTKFLLHALESKILKYNNFDSWVNWGTKFSSSVVTDISCSTDKTIWGFSCANLESLRFAQENGIPSIHSQVDGGKGYYKIRDEVWGKYSFAEKQHPAPSESFLSRIEEELFLSGKIVVNSTYIKSLLEDTYPFLKSKNVQVLPLSFEFNFNSTSNFDKLNRDGNFTILWVGNINLMKGFMSFFETAKALSGKGFKFIAVGKSHLKESFFKKASNYIEFKGVLNKANLFDEYRKSHVFVFPTLCDSFGMVQLEAMSFGLPVIATTNCANVVKHNYNGYNIETDSADLIIQYILNLQRDKDLFDELSKNAYYTATTFNMDKYIEHIKKIIF